MAVTSSYPYCGMSFPRGDLHAHGFGVRAHGHQAQRERESQSFHGADVKGPPRRATLFERTMKRRERLRPGRTATIAPHDAHKAERRQRQRRGRHAAGYIDDGAAGLRARTGYVYDQAAPIGVVILGAPYSQSLEVTFHGRAAHSGMHPEDGRSAIAAAARAISEFRLGRVDADSTANVGTISGGTATNIVPEWCTFVAEARSQDERKLADLIQEMQDAITFAAGVADCDVETKARKSYRGYRFAKSDRAVALAADALARRGHEVTYELSGGAADANVFNERGLECVNLANGMTDIHTPAEHIAVADLEAMVDVTLSLVESALAQ